LDVILLAGKKSPKNLGIPDILIYRLLKPVQNLFIRARGCSKIGCFGTASLIRE
jgi:hypothetical protein